MALRGSSGGRYQGPIDENRPAEVDANRCNPLGDEETKDSPKYKKTYHHSVHKKHPGDESASAIEERYRAQTSSYLNIPQEIDRRIRLQRRSQEPKSIHMHSEVRKYTQD